MRFISSRSSMSRACMRVFRSIVSRPRRERHVEEAVRISLVPKRAAHESRHGAERPRGPRNAADGLGGDHGSLGGRMSHPQVYDAADGYGPARDVFRSTAVAPGAGTMLMSPRSASKSVTVSQACATGDATLRSALWLKRPVTVRPWRDLAGSPSESRMH